MRRLALFTLFTPSIVLTYGAIAAAQGTAPPPQGPPSDAPAALVPPPGPSSDAPPATPPAPAVAQLPSTPPIAPADLPPMAPVEAAAPPPKMPAPPTGSFMLRPIGTVTAVRLDSLVAGYNGQPGPPGVAHSAGWVTGSILNGSYKFSPSWGVTARIGFFDNQPTTSPSGSLVTSPMIIGTYALAFDDIRVAFGLSASIPIGSGGGNNPDPGVAFANKQANFARSAYDGPLFNPNNMYITPSVDVGYVDHQFTVHYDLAFPVADRVRGEQQTPDASGVVLLSGLHLGYFVLPMFSLGLETRYQRFLTTFTPCTKSDTLCDNLSIAEGARLHFRVGEHNWFRPGVSFTEGVKGALKDQGFSIVQLDLPLSF